LSQSPDEEEEEPVARTAEKEEKRARSATERILGAIRKREEGNGNAQRQRRD
jgi:hypothetical protein